jgi:RimJ/RimL family protein N-acetyltransferase
MNAAVAADVRLRPLAPDDADFYASLYADAALLAHVGPPLSPAAARRSFAAALRHAVPRVPLRRRWIIELDGRPVGLMGLLGDAREAEMGCVVLPAFQGRGVSRAATRALARLGFAELGLARLHARCALANAAAIAVLARAGFTRGADAGDEATWEWLPDA